MTAQLEEILEFLCVTAQGNEPKRARIARQAAWTVLFVLSAFAVAGSVILKVFYQRPVRNQNLV